MQKNSFLTNLMNKCYSLISIKAPIINSIDLLDSASIGEKHYDLCILINNAYNYNNCV